MGPCCRCSIVVRRAGCYTLDLAISCAQALVLRHAIMRAVKPQTRNSIIALDTCRLLKPLSEIIADLAEDANLALDDLLVGALGHVTGNIVDEALLRPIVKDFLPQSTWGVEILGPDLGEEGDGLASKVSMGFVQVNGPAAEGDWLNGGEVVWSSALVVECH